MGSLQFARHAGTSGPGETSPGVPRPGAGWVPSPPRPPGSGCGAGCRLDAVAGGRWPAGVSGISARISDVSVADQEPVEVRQPVPVVAPAADDRLWIVGPAACAQDGLTIQVVQGCESGEVHQVLAQKVPE